MESGAETLAEADFKGLGSITSHFWNYLTSQDLWVTILLASIKIIGILLISYIVILVGKRLITNIFALGMRTPLNHSERRQKTILKLLQSVLSYIVYFSAILAVLSVLEINVAGLLAGAGIAGLAIGFGGLFLVDTPEQRRLGIRDSYDLAWQDWLGTAGFDRLHDEDIWGYNHQMFFQFLILRKMMVY